MITCNGVAHKVTKSTFGKPYFCTVDAKGQDEQPFEGEIPDADKYVVSIISLQAISRPMEDVNSSSPMNS